MRTAARTWPEVIARLVDTNDDGDMANPVTAELVQELCKCDLIIGGVMAYITAPNTIHDDAFWYGAYARVAELPTEPTPSSEARRKLAELFGAACAEDLHTALRTAVSCRERADEERRRAWEAHFSAERRMRDAEDLAREMLSVLCEVDALAREARDKKNDRLGALILSAIAEQDSVWREVFAANARPLSEKLEQGRVL